MTNEDCKARMITGLYLRELAPERNAHHVADDVKKLYRLAARFQAREVHRCNVGEYPDGAKQEEQRDSEKVRGILMNYPRVRAMPCNDARGAGLWLHFPAGYYNSMGGKESGWGLFP